MKKEKKKSGCSVVVGVILFIVVFLASGGNDSTTSSTSTGNAKKPVATATVEPQYYSMPIDQAAPLMAEKAQSNYAKTRSVTCYTDVIEIDIDLKNDLSAQSMFNTAISHSMNTFTTFFEHAAVPQVYIRYWEPGRDKYGNEVDMCTITMRLERETYQKINWDFYKQNRFTHAKTYLEILDGNSLHADYKKLLNK